MKIIALAFALVLAVVGRASAIAVVAGDDRGWVHQSQYAPGLDDLFLGSRHQPGADDLRGLASQYP